MRLRFTPQAIEDLESISDYFAERNPPAGRRVRDSILHSLSFLTKFPEIGRRQTAENVRKFVTRKYAYLVYYSVDRDASEVVVLSIQHPAKHRDYEDA